jgi:hypothetical protein
MKFKIGDRVKVKSTGEINILTETYLIKHERKGHLVNDIYGTIDTYFKLGNSQYRFLEEDLELVQTSEQIAVEKALKEFKEELKDKINEIDIWNKNGLKVKKEVLELLK